MMILNMNMNMTMMIITGTITTTIIVTGVIPGTVGTRMAIPTARDTAVTHTVVTRNIVVKTSTEGQ